MSVAEETMLAIHVEPDHLADGCTAIAQNMLDVLDNGRYAQCSVMKLPASIDEWRAAHRTARKRAMRAERLGYRFAQLHRERHEDEIFAIRTSKQERQGRPMDPAYLERPSFSPLPAYACGRHGIRTWGVFSADRVVVAYLVMYRAGQLALVSEIMGHGDYEPDGIMYLLYAGALEHEIGQGHGTIVYNRHDSGTDGLRFYKERLGLTERRVQWCR